MAGTLHSSQCRMILFGALATLVIAGGSGCMGEGSAEREQERLTSEVPRQLYEQLIARATWAHSSDANAPVRIKARVVSFCDPEALVTLNWQSADSVAIQTQLNMLRLAKAIETSETFSTGFLPTAEDVEDVVDWLTFSRPLDAGASLVRAAGLFPAIVGSVCFEEFLWTLFADPHGSLMSGMVEISSVPGAPHTSLLVRAAPEGEFAGTEMRFYLPSPAANPDSIVVAYGLDEYRAQMVRVEGDSETREEIWELQRRFSEAPVTLDTVVCSYRRHGERWFMIRSQGASRNTMYLRDFEVLDIDVDPVFSPGDFEHRIDLVGRDELEAYRRTRRR